MTALRTTTLIIADVLAVHAVRAIEFALGAVPGVHAVDATRERTIVTHDPHVSDAMLAEAVALAGCTVASITRTRTLPVV
ncbi:MAG: heavy-metal-associated domain-containing protein [Gemmatimonadaceae bacterium]|nr:heavy-metal-associated domain-containing protein [Gemmatimonadaceae bacterium]